MVKRILVIVLFAGTMIYPQVIYTPLNSGVYDFLERLALKKVISLNDEVKPFSRKYIAEQILKAEAQPDELNKVEKEELKFYKKEYAFELGLSSDSERYFMYSYSDSLFRLRFSPVGGYGISGIDNNSGHTRWVGVNVYVSYSDKFGAGFVYKDIGEFGDNVDREKRLSPAPGYSTKNSQNGIEFSDVRGNMSYDFDWGSVSIIKDYANWGHSRFGSVILSDKAPSFPQLRLQFNPVPWMKFSYIHGWLNSNVLDSTEFYYNQFESREPFLRRTYVDKYFAGNILTVSPVSWLDVSLGNTFVYSGSLRPEMFIPFMYYKAMDHNTGRGDVDDGNGQIFFDVAVKHPKFYQFYSSLLIDVLETREILDGNWYTSWFGYSAGMRRTDLFIDNLSVALEYSKTNPWVYENKDESVTYKHLDYPLGHWIGQNADHLRIQVDYIFIRGLKFSAYADRFRKGGMNDIVEAYKDRKNLPFLYGTLRKDFRYGVKASYEILHDLFVKAEYEYSNITDQDKTRTQTFMSGHKNSFMLLVNYGL